MSDALDLGLLYETVCEQYDQLRWPGGMPRTGVEVAECGRHARHVLHTIWMLHGPVTAADIRSGQESYRHGLRAPTEHVDLVREAMRESGGKAPHD